MTDRNKVIEGLEYLITAYAFHGDDAECLGGALELLKEQEPRVLTHDEAIVLPEGTPVWFEESTDAGQTFISPMICHGNGLYGNQFMKVDAKQLHWRGRRIWTAKPDDKQRKAVQWDEGTGH